AAPRRTGPSCSSGSSLLAPPAAAHDVPIGGLALLAGAIAKRGHAPRGDRVTARGGRSLTAAVGMVHRIHRGASGLGPYAEMARAARLPPLDVLVVGVPDRPHGGPALGLHHPHLARGQAQRDALALLGQQLDARAGGASQLP